MAENDNIIFPVGDDRENLEIRKINNNGTIGELIETVNTNFENIARHGGGPAGKDGINGLDGVDGVNVEYIYCLSDEMVEGVHYPSSDRDKSILFEKLQAQYESKYTGEGGVQTTWYNYAQPISIDQKNEYVMARYKITEYNWAYADPVLWAHWGETGKDGDGVEYIFLQSTKELNGEELDNLILKKEHMTSPEYKEYQKIIYGLDEFYPGETWFNAENKQRARMAITNAGITINEGGFNILWQQRFGFFTNGESNKWTDEPKGTGFVSNSDSDVQKKLIQFEYVSIRRSYRDENDKKVWTDFSVPSIWSNYSLPTATVMIYYNADEDETPTGPAVGTGYYNWTTKSLDFNGKSDAADDDIPSGWTEHHDEAEGKIVWMCYGLFDNTGENQTWSSPVRLTGEPGKAGEDGTFIEFIYTSVEKNGTYNYPIDDQVAANKLFDDVEAAADHRAEYRGTFWWDRALPISYDEPIVYVWIRRKSNGSDWVVDPAPIVWSRWGEDGMDGDGVEYIFVTTNANLPEDLSLPKYSNLNPYQKKLFQINDFVPSANWFVEKNKQKAIDALKGSFSEEQWTNKYGFDSYSAWTDNPASVDPEHKYQWVSIRRSENDERGKAVWQDFGEPKLWSKYSTSIFTAYAFIATKAYDDLSGYQPHGLISISDPRPESGDTYHGVQITWTDGPITSIDKPVVWVTSAKVNEDNLSTIQWSHPIKMADTAEFNVEWCSDDIIGDDLATLIDELASSEYNFGRFLADNNNIESDAEDAWRTYVQEQLGLEFSDSTENAILMATCQYTSGTWSNWELVRVKGEDGEDGRPLNVVGRIQKELYLPENTEYTLSSATTYLNSHQPSSANNGDLLIVYPHTTDAGNNESGIYYGDGTGDKGGALYMWVYHNNSWVDYNTSSNGETTYNTYASPNCHLILWDGDSWQDMGRFKGDTGDRYALLVKYANDVNGVRTYVSSDPSAKWIGVLTYIDGSENPNDILVDDPRWNWSLFKGQDGYGYEYIFKRTSNNSAPSVPSTTSEQDRTDEFHPNGWSDEPMEPTSDNRYVWMCWRKYDKNNGVWSKFMGENNKTSEQSGLAKRWNIFTNGITGVVEYFHADTTSSPSDAAYIGDPTDYPSYWFSSSSAAGWGLNKKYLFNVEVIEYLDGSAQIMDPHFVTMYEDGIKDVTDYYCLDSDGETAPAMSGGVPVTTGTSQMEGKSWWTTNAKKTPIGRGYEYLWNITKKTYEGGKADEWTTPLVIGVYTEGSSTIYADLDNEMDSVQVDSDKKVITASTFTSHLTMYYGQEKLNITRCDISGEEPLSGKISFSTIPSGGTDTVTMTLNLNQGYQLPELSHKIVFTVTANLPGNGGQVSRIATYTLLATTHEYVYSINITPNSIIKPTSGSVTPSTLSISVVERNGINTTTYESPNSRFDVYVSKNGNTKTKLTSFSYSTSGLDINDRITFTVETSVNGTNTVLDTETIYVLREGTDGIDGVNGKDGKDGTNGKDGKDGVDGNGYQYCYVRYTNADESKYGGATTPTVTQAYTTSNPTFKIGNETVPSSSTPQGADAEHTYEYRSERSGYDGNWSKWSTPVTIARYLDAGDIDQTISREVNNAETRITSAVNTQLSDVYSDISDIFGDISSLNGDISGLNGDISSLNGDISSLNGDISSLNGNISSLNGKFNSDGTIKDNYISTSTKAGIVNGYLKTESFASTLQAAIGGVTVSVGGSTKVFSDYIDYEHNQITTANTNYNALSGRLDQYVTSLSGYTTTTAFNDYKASASTRFGSIETGVANAKYMTDKDGYLLYKDNNGEYQKIPKTGGGYAQLYTEVASGYSDKLILTTTELATIYQTVSDGVAAVDIFVNKDDHSAGMVFQASQDGSTIAMRANEVGITSDYFTLDKTGLKFNSKNGQTSLGSDGILRAENAVISGNIKANEFEASMQTSISTSAYINGSTQNITGTADKVTTIDGQSITITTTGTVNVGSTAKTINNSLYIKLVDVLDNPGNSEFSDKLICVPVLCMNYEGKEYMLSPASWMTNNIAQDTSNAKWMRTGGYYSYDFSAPNSSSVDCVVGTSSQSGCNYYIFLSGNMVTNFGSKTLYRMTILDWGTKENDSSAGKSVFQNNGLLNSDGTLGVLTEYDNITDKAYIGSSTQAKITSGLISTYVGYKLRYSVDYGTQYSKNISNASTYGISDMVDHFNSRLNSDLGFDYIWESDYNGAGGYARFSTLDDLLPYSRSRGTDNDRCNLNLTITSKRTLASPYFNFNTAVNEIYCRYYLQVFGDFSDPHNNYITLYPCNYGGMQTQPEDRYVPLARIIYQITFDFILRPTSTFSPADNNEILTKVKTYLENFNFNDFGTYIIGSGYAQVGKFEAWLLDDNDVTIGHTIQTKEPRSY